MNDDHRLAGRNIWVIGASSGIGAALATELVARGARVAISARRNDELDAVAAGRMTVVTVDVTDRAGVDAAVGQVRDELGEIDMVVYNAGFWERMDASAWDRDLFARHVEINLLGLNNCIGAVLPEMMQAGRGHLVSVASVAGYRGLAGAEAYGATKAAQINLLEALRGAVASRGISVTTVCPGFVRTDLTAKNTFPMPFMIDADAAARSDLRRPRTWPDGDRVPAADGRADEGRSSAPCPGVGRDLAPDDEPMNAETMNTESMDTETMDTEATNTDVNPKWRGCSPPSRAPLRSAIARPMIRRAVAGLPLRVQFPDGVRFGAGGATDPQMVVHRPEAFFARLAADAKIGFGEAYMAGDWDTGPGTDLADLLTPLAAQRDDDGAALVAAIQAARRAAPTR